MKLPALVIGDMHIKLSNLSILDRFCVDMYELVRSAGIKTLVFLGDQYDGKSLIHADVQTFFINRLIHFLGLGVDRIYVIVGNHDFAGSDLHNHSLVPLQYISDKITVIDNTLGWQSDEQHIFVAYNNSEEITDYLKNSGVSKDSVVFGHFEVNGFCYSGNRIVSDAVDAKKLKGAKTILGHFHGFQKNKNISYLGSPISHSFNEANQDKWVLIIDEDEKFVYRKIVGLPQHRVISYNSLANHDLKEEDIIKIVDIPFDKYEDVKNAFASYGSVQYSMAVTENNDIRIDDNNSYDIIIKEYLDKNFVSDKYSMLDKKHLHSFILDILKEE